MDYIFTKHAEYRIRIRRLTKEEVLDAIKYAEITIKKHGKYYAQKRHILGAMEVVYEKTENYIKIITVYWM